jgi:hypothetical protein
MSNGERRLKNVEVDKSKKYGLEHIPILILDTSDLILKILVLCLPTAGWYFVPST